MLPESSFSVPVEGHALVESNGEFAPVVLRPLKAVVSALSKVSSPTSTWTPVEFNTCVVTRGSQVLKFVKSGPLSS